MSRQLKYSATISVAVMALFAFTANVTVPASQTIGAASILAAPSALQVSR